MIPQDRSMYLELAKMNRHNRKMIMMYFKNYVRALKNERGAAGTATQDKHLKNNYTTILPQKGAYEHEL